MVDKIRVLFVTASTKGGGAERMLFNIIKSLDSNHQARLFVTSDDKVPEIYSSAVDASYANKQHAVSAFPKLIKELRMFRPHHVFTTSSNIGYMLVLAKKLLAADFKIYIRCAVPPSEMYHTDLKSRILGRINRMTYNHADLVIAQTDFSRQDLIEKYKINPARVRTIRNIVDTEFVYSQSVAEEASEMNSDDYNIVAAGALYSVKGFDILIDALATDPIEKNKHLYILGEERYEVGYKQFLIDKIKELGLDKQIHLLGHKQNPYPYLRKANLFVMSSRKEGYPNVVLEALTLGTPVVATDVVDWSGVIEPGVNGFVVRKNDIRSIREGINKAFNATLKKTEMRFENFDYNELFC